MSWEAPVIAKGRILLRGYWLRWLDRRIAPASEICLNQRQIFIFPTRYGFFYLLTSLLLFIAGLNYENSLILNLCFLLLSLFIVCILHTYRNLSGLCLRAGSSQPNFAGERASFEIILSKKNRRHYEAIDLQWRDCQSLHHDLIEQQETRARLLLLTQTRGLFKPGRIKVQTRFPLGLIRAWSWVDLDLVVLVYPQPLAGELLTADVGEGREGNKKIVTGHDDFDELKTWQPGESLKRVAWKQFARGQGMYTKVFHGLQTDEIWLRWQQVKTLDTERRLSILCYWVLQYAQLGQPFGLQLPAGQIEPNQGQQHKKRCLEALALYSMATST